MKGVVVTRALSAYGYAETKIFGQQKGYRNTSHFVKATGGTKLNLIIYKDEPAITHRIHRIHQISTVLAKHELPVRYPLSDRILTLRTPNSVRYAGLYNYLHGATIPWEAYTKHHIKLVGMALARMHGSLESTVYDASFPRIHNEMTSIIDSMEQYYAQDGVKTAMKDKLQIDLKDNIFLNMKKTTELCGKLPNQHQLHMDFVRGNILFCENSTHSHNLQVNNYAISGILDLEKTSVGHPVFDIARTLAFLLVDSKYKAEEKVRKYFLISGYAKRGNKKLPNIQQGNEDVLEILITLFLVYDFYKFMKHNPYESLPKNEHYLRTKDILQARGVLA